MFKTLKSLTSAILLASALMAPSSSFAQAADRWQFGAQIYGYFPTLDGKTNFPASGGTPEVSVDVDQVLENLQSVFMGSFEAKKGPWGAFTDLLYLDVEGDKSGTQAFTIGGHQVPGSASASGTYGLKGWIWTIAGEYNIVSRPTYTADVFAGARMIDLEQKVNWTLTGNIGPIPAAGRSGGSTVSETNWDAIIGVKGRWHFSADHRWFVPYYLDVGTGESDFTWQAMTGVGYSWKSVDLYAAWRYLDYDMGDSKPFSELSLNGPLVALAFRW